MRRPAIAIFFVLLFTQLCIAQSTPPSGQISSSIYDTGSGNVGIGTTNPGQALDIVGNALFETDSNFAIGSNVAGVNRVSTYTIGPSIRFLNAANDYANVGAASISIGETYGATAAPANGAIVQGTVGIGTTMPLAKLHVNDGTNRNFLVVTDATQLGTTGIALGSFNDATTAYAPLSILGSSIAISGNVGIGTTNPGAKLEVNGNLKVSGQGSSITFSDGSVQSTAWTGTLCGGDYAESVDVSDDRARYEPGDLLVIDPRHPGRFIKSAEPYSTAVTGVYSTKPGVVGRRQTTPQASSTTEVPMAMIGIVPTKVSAENGPIRPGDILVSSSIPGHAMKGTDRSLFAGAVVGKALGALDSGTGVIEVVVSLQ
jgi:hypothetical protein